MTKILAFYLPQYHPMVENDKFWGPGFTEWHNVVRAKSLFYGHAQPHLPGELGFYDLRTHETRLAQAELACEHGIDGFLYWHYWFGAGKRIMNGPFDEVVKSGSPDFPFALAWANHSWYKKNWQKEGDNTLLIDQTYHGRADFENHFYDMLEAFRDSRYIKLNGKLLFVIWDNFDKCGDFINVWRKLAVENGLPGFYFVARDANSRNLDKLMEVGFDAIYNDDVLNIHHNYPIYKKIFLHIFRKYLKIPTIIDYKSAINWMITDNCQKNNVIPVIAPNWDHSPRSGRSAFILTRSNPKLFKILVNKALTMVQRKNPENRIIFVKSWNEWGEGNYLEPDERWGRAYLIALRDAIAEFDEM
jgi:hypothetical protein